MLFSPLEGRKGSTCPSQSNTVTPETLKVWIQHSCLYKCLDLEVDSLWESNSSTGSFFFIIIIFLKIFFAQKLT